MKCEFCHNEFSNKQNLNYHQKKAKYCLLLQKKIQKNYLYVTDVIKNLHPMLL
jgi:hypothetical protein